MADPSLEERILAQLRARRALADQGTVSTSACTSDELVPAVGAPLEAVQMSLRALQDEERVRESAAAPDRWMVVLADDPPAPCWIARRCAHEIAARAAVLSQLSPQVSPTGLPRACDELEVFLISPEGDPVSLKRPELVEVAARQLARELIAEVVRRVLAQSQAAPADPRPIVSVPVTGQPYAAVRSDVRRKRLVGDPRALRLAIGLPRVAGFARTACVRCDTDEQYNAFDGPGSVISMRVQVLIEIAHPQLVGVADEPPQSSQN